MIEIVAVFDNEDGRGLCIRLPHMDYSIQATPYVADFSDANHAKNFAKYLTRMGSEKKNDLTKFNLALFNGTMMHGSGREFDDAAKLCNDLIAWFTSNVNGIINEVGYFSGMSDEFDESSIVSSCFGDLSEIWRQLGYNLRDELIVTHFDQGWKGSPAHYHRAFDRTKLTLFKMVLDGFNKGVVIVHPGLGQEAYDAVVEMAK